MGVFTLLKNGSSAAKCLLARNFHFGKLLCVPDAGDVKNYKVVWNRTGTGIGQQAAIPGGVKVGNRLGEPGGVSGTLRLYSRVLRFGCLQL